MHVPLSSKFRHVSVRIASMLCFKEMFKADGNMKRTNVLHKCY